jgi:hypothetical protein
MAFNPSSHQPLILTGLATGIAVITGLVWQRRKVGPATTTGTTVARNDTTVG